MYYAAEPVYINGRMFLCPTSAAPFILFEKAVQWGCDPVWANATAGYVRPDTLDDAL